MSQLLIFSQLKKELIIRVRYFRDCYLPCGIKKFSEKNNNNKITYNNTTNYKKTNGVCCMYCCYCNK